MPLADKIIELRKKQGWSQIDLADRLDVSRQSVSKWEMAQAVPELDKIIKMSELFAVTTDYLLKDNIPAPEQTGGTTPPPPETPPEPDEAGAPEPEQGPPPEEKPRRKKLPWALAAVVAAAAVIWVAAWAFSDRGEPEQIVQTTPIPLPSPTPPPLPADGVVMEEPVTEQAASTGPETPANQIEEYIYEEGAVTGGSIDPAELEAMAAEYAPFGVTCDEKTGQWYLDGEPIRTFTDVLSSNGEDLTGGHFHGVLRNFTGEGDIDVRTVRDFDHCDEAGHGTLLHLETSQAGLSFWMEHPAGEHHAEDHHE